MTENPIPSVAEAITRMTGIKPNMVTVGESAVGASFSMRQLQDALLGDDPLSKTIAEKRCNKTIGCGKSLVKGDGSPEYVFDTKEEAQTYEMEWRRTGLCPPCFDGALARLDDGSEDGDFPFGREEPECSGVCLYASDIGVPANGVAYAHPDCPLHGEDADVPHQPSGDGGKQR